MKFTVGILLTGFGTFWGARGAGAEWPHGDTSLPVVVSRCRCSRHRAGRPAPSDQPAQAHRGTAGVDSGGRIVIAWLRRFGAFWYDFVVGDDWRVAAGVVVALALTYVLSTSDIHPQLVGAARRRRDPADTEACDEQYSLNGLGRRDCRLGDPPAEIVCR